MRDSMQPTSQHSIMTQHTQLVVAQGQQQQQQQQQQQPPAAVQQQTSTHSNSNNNSSNNSNNNNNSTNASKSLSTSSTNTNQTGQTVAVQLSSQPSGSGSNNNSSSNSNSNNSNANNNNNPNNSSNNTNSNSNYGQLLPPPSSTHTAPIYNPSLPATNLYMPAAHGMPAHHAQSGAMYPAMIPAPMSSNVYVNNVTANVNLHGWAHTVPTGAWVHPGAAPHYIHGDMPPEQQAGSILQPMAHMPLSLTPTNNMGGTSASTNSGRGSRRGRRGGPGNGSRRSDYNSQRHAPPEDNSVPPNQNNDLMQQHSQQSLDAQQMMAGGGPPSYVPHTQYGGGAHHAQYPCAYPAFFAPQNAMMPAGQNSSAVQQATGTPLYFSAMPIYNAPHMYNYGYILPPVMNPADYQYMPGDEVVGDERGQPCDDGGAMLWHEQHMYAEEYSIASDMQVTGGVDDLNHHNASTMGSSADTPSLLSPTNYTPIYDAQLHEMQQQMSAIQIYDEQQLAQMQAMLPVGGVNQLDEELSECGGPQAVGSIQIVPTVPIITTAPMSLAGDGHMLHNLPPSHHLQPQAHLITADPALMPIEPVPSTTPIQTNAVSDTFLESTVVDISNEFTNAMASNESLSSSSLMESQLNQHKQLESTENVACEYQQQQQQHFVVQQQQQREQPQSLHEQSQTMETSIPEFQYNNTNNNTKINKILMIDNNTLDSESPAPPLGGDGGTTSETGTEKLEIIVKTTTTTTTTAAVAAGTSTTPQQPLTTGAMKSKQQPLSGYAKPMDQPQQEQQQQQRYSTVTRNMPSNTNKSSGAYHHQPYETRKQNQNYQQQQSRRKYDYQHHERVSGGSSGGGSNHEPGNVGGTQPTKSMSWTNSSQYKKSANNVTVTAAPSSGYITTNSHNNTKQMNSNSNASTYGHGSRTYTNQQHHNYHHQQQQQQQQQQQNYHQQSSGNFGSHSQTRNYGAMKVPSSPLSGTTNTNNNTANTSSQPFNTLERKNSQNVMNAPEGIKQEQSIVEASSQQQQQQQQVTTGIAANATTANITVTPHQLNQQQSNTKQSINPTNSSCGTASNVADLILTNKQYPPGFANKKLIMQQQSTVNNNNQQSTTLADTTPMPTINLAPPASTIQQTTQPPGRPLWTSLFNNNNSTSKTSIMSTNVTTATIGSSNSSTTTTITTTSSTTSNISTQNVNSYAPALPVPFAKKPVAKVAPYEGITPALSTTAAVTPGAMSYSAASAQGLVAVASATAPRRTSTDSCSSATAALAQRNNLDEYSVKFAEFLTKYKTDLSPISLRPRGLTNRSNYCYINSILQALLGCAPFYNLIRSIPKHAAILSDVKTPTVNAMVSFMSNFSNLSTALRLRPTKGPKSKDDLGVDLQCDTAFEPTEIYKLWNDSRDEHVEGRQEDAEEFLSYILNKLNDELLEVLKLLSKPNPEQNGQNEQSESEEGGDVWQMICNNRNKGSVTRQTDFGRTPLSDIFRGELRSHLQREGEYSTVVIQPFFTLQLYIEKAASVKEALEILVGRDQLEGVTGSKSKQEVAAWQQMNLEKLPIILILHLKWFDYRSDGCTKILKKVEFPVDLKIDAKILASKKYSQKQRIYRLFAVVYHDGKEASKGHYITDVYHTGYGSWLRYDDSSVKPVSENHVLTPRSPRVPYLLYYRRCDTMLPKASNHNNNNNTNTMSSGK